jgi:hypothetical protein
MRKCLSLDARPADKPGFADHIAAFASTIIVLDVGYRLAPRRVAPLGILFLIKR